MRHCFPADTIGAGDRLKKKKNKPNSKTSFLTAQSILLVLRALREFAMAYRARVCASRLKRKYIKH